MIKFTKMQGLGNDFICMNYEDVYKYNLKIFSKFICDRHFGIGADGLILIGTSKVADCKMRIFNSDGTEAEMCGNGIRCLAKYVYEKNIVKKEKIRIETLAGIKEVKYKLENEKIMALNVNMGTPQLDINKLPIYIPNNYKYKERKCKILIKAQDKEFLGLFLTVGNPHTVIEIKDIKNFEVTKYGKIVENYKYFPQKTNVEFVEIVNENNIKLRVWERGVGETFACGTGAVAAAYAMYIENKIKNNVVVELEGGKLNISIDEKTNEVYMEGPAVNIFNGEIDL
jgi:diaminopimelate epimerase